MDHRRGDCESLPASDFQILERRQPFQINKLPLSTARRKAPGLGARTQEAPFAIGSLEQGCTRVQSLSTRCPRRKQEDASFVLRENMRAAILLSIDGSVSLGAL